MILIFSLFLGFLVIWRGILPQKIKKKWKIIFAVAAGVIALKFYVLRIFGGKMFFAPEFSPVVILPAAWLFSVLLFFGAWLLIYEFARFVYFSVIRLKGQKKSGSSFFSNPLWRAAGLIPIVILVSFGMYEGLKDPVITKRRIVIKNLPSELEGLKIAHLSDIHADVLTGRDKIMRIVQRTNSLKPDIVAITGDFVDGRASVRGSDLEVLKYLTAPMGVYGVPGNHEYYSGYSEWMSLLRSYGVRMLENSHVMLAHGSLALGGVTDPAAIYSGQDVMPDVAKAFAGSEYNSVKILLAHQPELAESAAANSVTLQLSGHTHGGMVWGMDLLVAAFNHGRVAGEYEVNGMKLFISNGTGIWSGFPVRLGRRSEIVLLTLSGR